MLVVPSPSRRLPARTIAVAALRTLLLVLAASAGILILLPAAFVAAVTGAPSAP